MSSITLAQIAEKPITVATDDAISSLADSRQGFLGQGFPGQGLPGGRVAMFLRHPKGIRSLPNLLDAPGFVAFGLNDDNDA
jgi:hypothetical protein